MSGTIDKAGVERCVIDADKGFFSADNLRALKKNHLSYIIPLRRNSSLILDPNHFMNIFFTMGNR